jgi:hypothetical protein
MSNFLTKMLNFENQRKDVMMCTSSSMYLNCAMLFKLNPNIVPIQAITATDQLVFCSRDHGVAIYTVP